MSSLHENPDLHGTRFGQVVVTVDLALGDCVVIAPQRAGVTTVPRKMRLNSLDEIRGAYGVQIGLAKRVAAKHPHAADIARALKFAGEQIKAQQGKGRK
ncbi:hypothetical protein [Pseudophaeobacter sp.]|uniref:hypothetical protein n=1 Tax=Pseudophaeobacter sp. TaxID=1971739 RepID=UPI003A97B317